MLLCVLYIPHGSDESFEIESIRKEIANFISHMVQMKDCASNAVVPLPENFISHMVQMKEDAFVLENLMY